MTKRGVVWETLIPWMIGIGVLIFALIVILILNEKGGGAFDFLRDIVKTKGR